MRFSFDHDLHIHSQLSLCSGNPLQTTERILQYAKDNNLKTVALTDHFWDQDVSVPPEWYRIQDFAHISQAKPLPQDGSVRFLFGCETDMDMDCNVGIAPQNCDRFDFIVIATTHMNNMCGFAIREADHPSRDRRAQLWAERMEALLSAPLPFHKVGIAHPTCTLMGMGDRESYLDILNRIPDSAMEHVFRKAAQVGVGIELNRDDMHFADGEADTVLRAYRIAKKCGCKFYLGSDAHQPKTFLETKAIFQRAIHWLELEESDKLDLSRL